MNKDKCTVLKLGSLRNTHINFCNDNNFKWTSEKASTLGITFTNNIDEMLNTNLTPKLKEFDQCLHKWKRWKLSLFGKITVLKTFAMPKLIYPLTVLHNPDQEIINKIKKLMFNFLWDNKPDKISRDKIIQDYQHGGLKMLDVESFIYSLKCSWVKRIKLQQHSKWVKVYENMLNRYGKQFIFKCNLNIKDIENLDIRSTFLKDVLSAWSYANFNKEITDVGKEIIWNNTNIKLSNKPFVFCEWMEKGVIFIEHIYDYRKKQFYSFNEIQNLYGIAQSNFLNYHQLIKCIPKEWKIKLKSEGIQYKANNYLIDKLKPQIKTCRFIYTMLIQKKTTTNNHQENKWEAELSGNFEWKNIFHQIINITIDTKLRSFQYKYLMRILPNNEKLFKYNMVESMLCDFCNSAPESNVHLYWECSKIQPFWCQIRIFLQSKYSTDTTLVSYETVSLCNVNIQNNMKSNCINYILLLGKYFIFKNKYQKTIPNFSEFLNYLRYKLSLERLIAEMKNKVDVHNNKWSIFTS